LRELDSSERMRYRGQQRRRKPARLTTSQSHATFVSPPVIGGCTHAPVIIGGDCGFHADLLAEPVVFGNAPNILLFSIGRALLTGRDSRGGTEVAVQGGGNIVRGSKDTLRDRLARYRRQDQRDRKKVQEDKLDSCLVRARRRDH